MWVAPKGRAGFAPKMNRQPLGAGYRPHIMPRLSLSLRQVIMCRVDFISAPPTARRLDAAAYRGDKTAPTNRRLGGSLNRLRLTKKARVAG